jgi:hypothetical protein
MSARLASVAVAAVLTALAVLVPSASARFDGTTVSSGSNFAAAPAFCTGSTTLDASADSDVDEESPTANHGTATTLQLDSNAAKRNRPYLTFALPAVPADCTLTAATLRISPAITGGALASHNLYQITSPWTETGITWNTQPTTANPVPFSDPGISLNPPPIDLDALATVQAMYAGNAYGFSIRSTYEGSGSSSYNSYYDSREAPSGKPQLILTWG